MEPLCRDQGAYLLLAEGLAKELKPSGIDVLALVPGFMKTELMTLTVFGDFLAIDPNKVARVGLAKLGKKPVVAPGLRPQMIAFSTRWLPRWINTLIFDQVVARAHRSASVLQ